MTEYDLKAKICDILYGVDFACGRENCTSCGFSAMGYEECKNARKASVLIKSGLKFDTVVSHTATFDLLQMERINKLESQAAEAEHRARVAERALRDELVQKTIRLGVTDIRPWYIQAINEAEKVLAEEQGDGKKKI